MSRRETERWKFDSRTAPPEGAAATLNMTCTAARPIIFNASTPQRLNVGHCQYGHQSLLDQVHAIRGRPISWAIPVGRVVLPLPGGPETTAKSGACVISPCGEGLRCLHPGEPGGGGCTKRTSPPLNPGQETAPKRLTAGALPSPGGGGKRERSAASLSTTL